MGGLVIESVMAAVSSTSVGGGHHGRDDLDGAWRGLGALERAAGTVEVSVLGPVEVRHDGRALDLGSPKQRALVAALALARGRPVSFDGLVHLLWGDCPPGSVTTTLHAYVCQVRRVLEPQRARRAPASLLVTVPQGYCLRVAPAACAAARFEHVVGAEHRRVDWSVLGPVTMPVDELERTADRLDRALGWWRGVPYAELGDAPTAGAARARLEELRLVALEDRAAVALALGHHATTAAELAALTAVHPLRERLWALRAVALVRCGRQADALRVLGEVSQLLGEELGLDPSPELRALQTAVLRQDPALVGAPRGSG
jgi:DNA-binding SARP family transcriptional activator